MNRGLVFIVCLMMLGAGRLYAIDRSLYEDNLSEPKKDFVDLYYKEALEAYQIGKYRDAVGSLLKGLELDKNDRRLLLLMAKIQLKEHKFEEARAILESLLQQYPGWIDAMQALAIVYRNTMQYHKEFELLNKVYKQTGDKGVYDRIKTLYRYVGPQERAKIFKRVISRAYSDLLTSCKAYLERPSKQSFVEMGRKIDAFKNKMKDFGRPYKLDRLEKLGYILHLISSGYEEIGRDQLKQFLDEEKDSPN